MAAILYLGWTFFMRWSDNRSIVQEIEETKAEQARKTAEAYGGGALTILSFYSTPSIIQRGEITQLCYSVSNSESVRIEPPVKNVWPSLSRCVDVSPDKDTVYTLTAEDAEGNTVTADTSVKVQ